MFHEPFDAQVHVFGAAGVGRFLSEADGDCGAVVFVDDNSRLRDTKRGKNLVKVDGSFDMSTRATSSASQVDRQTNGCRLEDQEIGPPLKSMTWPC